jgi:hypothetical protein
VPNFAGYLPLLKNGALLTTQAGTNVTVSVRGNDFYINDARIISANIIIANGVAHVLDQVSLYGDSVRDIKRRSNDFYLRNPGPDAVNKRDASSACLFR